jgi:hypothetical protein
MTRGSLGGYVAIEPIKVWELVERAVSHSWSIPEFQRGFVWKATQVRDLAESLWLEFPIGSLLLWNSTGGQQVRNVEDGVAPSLWLVDGQQRTTALAILFGRKPYWWTGDWDAVLKRYDVRFDIAAKEEPYFLLASAATRKVKNKRYVPVRELLTLDLNKEPDQKKLSDLAKDIKLQGLCDGMDVMEVYTRLDRVRKIRDRDILSVTVHHELEQVVEIFARLNSRGTRVTEADIYLGIVASKAQGWVRGQFLPFVEKLKDAGFDLEPNLVFRSLTAVGTGKVRFKDIDEVFWQQVQVEPAWKRCTKGWEAIIQRLQEHGVLSDTPLPTQAALVTLVSLQDKFPDAPSFNHAFYWFVQASRFGRYSGSATTSMEEDLKAIGGAASVSDAVSALLAHIVQIQEPVRSDDFMRDYTDGRFWRFLLYLLVRRHEAQDWDSAGNRLGFQGVELLEDYAPQWHHIFPKKFLGNQVDEGSVNALANIAAIGPSINIRISNKDPMKYLDKYSISDTKLQQQFVEWPRADFTIAKYDAFLAARAQQLADAANAFLMELSEGLPPAARPTIS